CSEICTPGAEVAIGLNSPRTSLGAAGLRANMSWGAAPPRRERTTTCLALGLRAGGGPARNSSGGPTPPTRGGGAACGVARRGPASHGRGGEPRTVSMGGLLGEGSASAILPGRRAAGQKLPGRPSLVRPVLDKPSRPRHPVLKPTPSPAGATPWTPTASR